MVARGLNSVVELARYRGRFGQLDWMAHRLSGLGVVLFLMIHIIDTATVYFAPAAYGWFINIYRNPVFGVGEIILGGAVIYHALNGLRIIIMDFWPALWERQPQARIAVWVLFVVLWLPLAGIMGTRIVQHLFNL